MATPSPRVPAVLALSVVLSAVVLPAAGAWSGTTSAACYPRGADGAPADPSIWHRWLVVEEGFLADVVVTRDGLLLVGQTVGKGGRNAGLLVEMDAHGDIRSRRIYHEDGGFLAGAVLPSGDFAVAGWLDEGYTDRGGDLWLSRYDPATGAEVWSRRWRMSDFSRRGEEQGELVDVTVTRSGDILAVGTGIIDESENTLSERRGGVAILVAPDGTERWYREFPEEFGGVASVPTRRGFVIVERTDYGPETAGGVIRIDADGTLVERWDVREGRQSYSAEPSAGPGRIRVASVEGVVSVVWPNGTTSWQTTVDGRPTDVVAGPNGSTVVAVRGAEGTTQLRWYSRTGELVATASRAGEIRELQRFGDTIVLLLGAGGDVETVERLPADLPVVRVAAAARPGRNDTNVVTLNASASSARTGVAEYGWDFDVDGVVDERTCEPTVTRRFDQQGVPVVGVTVTSGAGIRTTANVAAPVVDTIPPTPGLATPENRLVAAGRAARLDASASTDNYGVAEYHWDFDADGTVDAVTDGPGVEHRYRGIDENHTLALTAVDAAGNANRTTFQLRSVRNDAPDVELTHGPAFTNDDTTLTPVVDDRVGTIARVAWHLPDGTTVTRSGPEPIQYRFEAPGTHVVRVTVEDEYGATGTAEADVVVRTHYPTGRDSRGAVVEPLLNWLALLVVVGVPLGRAVADTVRRDGG